jgi:hypothetical protein
MGKLIDLTGRRFGRLLVVRLATPEERANRKDVYWLCKCDCGNEKIISGHSLKRGLILSCSCLQKEITSKRTKTHGESRTKFYKLWNGIIDRCENPTSSSYHNYGAKGITVCTEWHKYENFKEWALANGYKEGLSIDRIDNNKGYYPENCRWVTFQEQQNNKKDNHYITYNNKTMSLGDWARELKCERATIYARLQRGWTEEEAVSTPIGHRRKKKEG